MRASIIVAGTLAALGLAGTARAQALAGGLELSGTSTVGDWRCREPTIQPESSTLTRQSAGGESAPGALTLRFPVHDIDCGDAVTTDNLRRALEAERHPSIGFALAPDELERAAQAGSASVAVDGALTIAGRTQPVRTEITVTPAAGGALRVRGQQSLRMSAFGVKPPRLLFGALKVRDLVHVAFDFVLRAPAASLMGHGPSLSRR